MARPVVLEGVADGLSGGVLHPFRVSNKLVYVANDSESYDLKINFDATTQEGGSFTLKPGEVVSDVPMTSFSISLEGVGGAVNYRVMGV